MDRAREGNTGRRCGAAKKKKKRIPIFLDTVWKGVKDKHFYIMTSFHSYII
jgi:hypothetical protein